MLKPGLIIAVLVIVLDQLTKVWAESALTGHRPVEIFSWFNLRLAYNEGAAFSLLGEAGGWQRWLFITVGIVIAGVIAGWLKKLRSEQRWQGLALALLLGGAIGNLIDRILYGHVIDFIDWHYAGWHWPTFNIADSAISVGVVLLLLILTFDKTPEKDADHDHRL